MSDAINSQIFRFTSGAGSGFEISRYPGESSKRGPTSKHKSGMQLHRSNDQPTVRLKSLQSTGSHSGFFSRWRKRSRKPNRICENSKAESARRKSPEVHTKEEFENEVVVAIFQNWALWVLVDNSFCRPAEGILPKSNSAWAVNLLLINLNRKAPDGRSTARCAPPRLTNSRPRNATRKLGLCVAFESQNSARTVSIMLMPTCTLRPRATARDITVRKRGCGST